MLASKFLNLYIDLHVPHMGYTMYIPDPKKKCWTGDVDGWSGRTRVSIDFGINTYTSNKHASPSKSASVNM